MSNWQIMREATGEIIVPDLELADSWISRFKGLMFRKRLAPGKAILLVPCSSVHTHWLRFSIDILLLDRHGKVLDQKLAVKPWKFVMAPPNTFGVLEWSSGEFKVETGERLRVVTRNQAPPDKVPSSLGYLYRQPQ